MNDYHDEAVTVHVGDALEVLRTLPSASIQTVVTSPPYWGLRDYRVAGQLGLESTPEEYVANLVGIFAEVKRILRGDGTLWLNLGDSYNNRSRYRPSSHQPGLNGVVDSTWRKDAERGRVRMSVLNSGVKEKDLWGIPWRVAFALQADGWWVRSEITWCKTACMPESVTDRPTVATEKIFLLTKGARYYYDAGAARQPDKGGDHSRIKLTPPEPSGGLLKPHMGIRYREGRNGRGANLRNYWVLGPDAYQGAHFATFPAEIPKRAILAGTRPRDTVLDPFAGSGTSLAVAKGLDRLAIGIELNPDYLSLIRARVQSVAAQPELPLTEEAS